MVLPDGAAAGTGSERGEEQDEEDEEDEDEEEEEWTGDPNNRPIWKFPVVSRVRDALSICCPFFPVATGMLNVVHNPSHQVDQTQVGVV